MICLAVYFPSGRHCRFCNVVRSPAREGTGGAALALDVEGLTLIPAQPQEPQGQTYACSPEEEHARDGHGFRGGWCVHGLCLGTSKSALEQRLVKAIVDETFRPPEW